jgi:hypothetical protein
MQRAITVSICSLTIVVGSYSVVHGQVAAPAFPADSPRTALPATPPPPAGVAPAAPAAPAMPAAPAAPVGPPQPLSPDAVGPGPAPTETLPARPGPATNVPVPNGTTTATPPAVTQRPPISVFERPGRLSEPADQLFSELGFIPAHSVPLTPQTSFDIAYACYARELFADAIVLANHGLKMSDDARLHLIKGDCQLYLGYGRDAERTAADFRAAVAANQTFGLAAARERVNDPMRVRFDNIVEYQSTGH